jgi:ribosomal protein S18 acetylase RimI-like enzyme
MRRAIGAADVWLFALFSEDTALEISSRIRAPKRDDIDAMKAVIAATDLFPPDMLDDMFQPFLTGSTGALWLVFEETAISGLAFCAPETLTDGTWNLLLIAIDPRAQGTGIGMALVNAIESRLRQEGARILLVETSGQEAFSRSRRFYVRCGFVEEARIRSFYADGDDKVVFWKAL